MLPFGHQVEVIGKLDHPGELLQDTNAEPLAAFLKVHPLVS